MRTLNRYNQWHRLKFYIVEEVVDGGENPQNYGVCLLSLIPVYSQKYKLLTRIIKRVYSIPAQNVRFLIKTRGQFKDTSGQSFNSEHGSYHRVSVDTGNVDVIK